jgi:hypothetical protein
VDYAARTESNSDANRLQSSQPDSSAGIFDHADIAAGTQRGNNFMRAEFRGAGEAYRNSTQLAW